MTQRRNKSAKPRFNIDRKADPKEPVTIYLVYRYKKDATGKRIMLKYSTGERIPVKQWDSNYEFVKSGNRFPKPMADAINIKLVKFKETALQIVKENPNIEISDFKLQLDYMRGIKEKPKSKNEITLIEYAQKYVRKIKVHDRTLMKFMRVIKLLKEYQTKLEKDITFDMMNAEFSENFANFLYKTYEHSQNNVAKNIAILKQFIKDAHINGYHNNMMYQNNKFSVQRIKTSKHYLLADELRTLAKHSFKNETLQKVADLWLIAAYTGLRFSDFSRLDETHFFTEDGVEMIKIMTYKGRESKADNEVVIPVLPELHKILKKYNGDIPESLSSQRMNEYIKDALAEAEIKREVIDMQSKSGKVTEEKKAIHDCITNHSARYTFINLMLNHFGVPPQQLMKITGQTLKVLMGYERGDKERNAVKVAKTIKAKRKLKVV